MDMISDNLRFGPTGPYKDRRAYDVMVSAMGGLLSITGPEDGTPCKVITIRFYVNDRNGEGWSPDH
jgi:crotonobetainyl-CoA:carnitine CoA-transferase CaiB-like acyl-CoA transferase